MTNGLWIIIAIVVIWLSMNCPFIPSFPSENLTLDSPKTCCCVRCNDGKCIPSRVDISECRNGYPNPLTAAWCGEDKWCGVKDSMCCDEDCLNYLQGMSESYWS